MTAFTLIAILD